MNSHSDFACIFIVPVDCSTESSDSMGGQATMHGVDEAGRKLGLALNPNRAEMPSTKRKGHDQVKLYMKQVHVAVEFVTQSRDSFRSGGCLPGNIFKTRCSPTGFSNMSFQAMSY